MLLTDPRLDPAADENAALRSALALWRLPAVNALLDNDRVWLGLQHGRALLGDENAAAAAAAASAAASVASTSVPAAIASGSSASKMLVTAARAAWTAGAATLAKRPGRPCRGAATSLLTHAC